MASGDAQHIPIDIHLGQLSDWLISRRHCPKDWLSNLHKIREKLAVLYPALLAILPDRSSPEAEELPSAASELTYLHCKTILQLLSETEHGTKNMLGQFQSTQMKELAEVLKLYEKDSTYLAELAQTVYRNITYDVPFLKKQMLKLDQQSSELAKKTNESLKSAADFREQYFQECAALGIQGQNVHEELLAGAKILPKLYDNIAQRMEVLEYVCKYVQDFIAVVHKGDWVKDQSGPTLFAFIHHLIAHGNTPYPFMADMTVVSPALNVDVMNTTPHTAHDKGERGDGGEGEEGEGSSVGSLEVNLNDTVADHLDQLNGSSIGGGSIDFDLPEPEDGEEGDGEVNWDMDTDGLNIVLEDGGESAKRNILESPEHRTQVINELHELLAFLQRRLTEESTDHMASDLLNVQSVQFSVQSGEGGKKTQQMIGHVRDVLALFDDHRLQSLCKLHDSSTFLDRLTRQLEQKVVFCERMESRAEDFRIRRFESKTEKEKLEPELTKLIKETKKIQKFVENDVSKRYQDRRVTILGGVQSVS